MTIDPFIVGELKADGGKGEAVKPYERHDPDNATAPFLSFIPDAKRDELIGALLESLERSDQRETDFYMVRSFIGGLGLLAAQFAPQAECAPQQTDAEALYELPERVIDQLYQSAGVSTFHPDGDQREKLYAFANAVAAETVARIAAPTPERADAEKDSEASSHAALTDDEISRVAVAYYADGSHDNFLIGFARAILAANKEST
jgi:hypothetical protein